MPSHTKKALLGDLVGLQVVRVGHVSKETLMERPRPMGKVGGATESHLRPEQ